MTPSPQQAAFREELLGSSSSVILDARAGCGKTTTLVSNAACLAPGLALAFNVRIKEELATKLPSIWHVKTTNGHGHGAWAKLTGKTSVLDTGKIIDEAKRRKIKGSYWADLKRLVEMARSMGYVPSHGVPDPIFRAETSWPEVFDACDIDPSDELQDYAEDLLIFSIKAAWTGQIDFADQLYMPVVYGATFPRYLSLIVDEAQDLSMMQHKMIAQSLHSEGRVIAAGDKHQAIYGFRGAMEESFAELTQAFSAKILPLTTSYRCPQLVVAEAKWFVDSIEAAESAPLGLVEGAWDTPLAEVELSSFSTATRPQALLCRNNAPLISMAFKLLKSGIGCTILGRDFAAGLKSFFNKHRAETMAEVMIKAKDSIMSEMAIAKANEKEAKVERLFDKLGAVEAILEGLPPGASHNDLLQTLDSMFSDKDGRITLSTVHKAKGLEWPLVSILGPNLFHLGVGQEDNLAYVAVTRSQDTLRYLTARPKLRS